MTRDDIIKMARDAGFYGSEILGEHDYDVVGLVADLERFAALVAATEREACAKVCEESHWSLDDRNEYAAAIRARGKE